MTQYIDKNRVEEIIRNLWKKDDGNISEHRIYYNKALQEVQCELDTIFINFEETMKGVQIYNDYKEEQWIEKACNWLREQKEMIGISFQEDFIERFKMAMKK